MEMLTSAQGTETLLTIFCPQIHPEGNLTWTAGNENHG